MAGGFRIGDEVVEKGARRVVHLPIAHLYSHDAPLTLPVHVVRGRRAGPTLFISAVIHGDELNGLEIVRRVLDHRALRRMSGTLLAVPVVNGFGMLHQSRYLPDRRDLNRSFPGSVTGSLAARLAYIFAQEIVSRSEYGIDLHTGASHRDNLPQVRANLDDTETLSLARSFGVPVVIHAATRDGSLRASATDLGVKMLLYEAGEALRFGELAVRVGLLGIIRVMRYIGMLPRVRSKVTAQPFIARSSSWVRAPSTGVVTLSRRLGELVEPGEVLAWIADPYDLFADRIPVHAEKGGVVVGLSTNPLLHEGDALAHVARFAEPESVVEEVLAFRDVVLDGPSPN